MFSSALTVLLLFLVLPRPPRPPLFPYTTLFRSARLRRALIPVPCPSRLDGLSPHPAHGTQFEVKYFNSSICSRSFNASSNPSAMSDKSLLVRIHRPIGSTLHQIRTLPDRAIFCSEP